MERNILISIIVFMLIYVVYMLIKSYNESNRNKYEAEITWKNINYLVCDEKMNIKAFISITDENITIEQIEAINKTLIENHGYRIYKTKK